MAPNYAPLTAALAEACVETVRTLVGQLPAEAHGSVGRSVQATDGRPSPTTGRAGRRHALASCSAEKGTCRSPFRRPRLRRGFRSSFLVSAGGPSPLVARQRAEYVAADRVGAVEVAMGVVWVEGWMVGAADSVEAAAAVEAAAVVVFPQRNTSTECD